MRNTKCNHQRLQIHTCMLKQFQRKEEAVEKKSLHSFGNAILLLKYDGYLRLFGSFCALFFLLFCFLINRLLTLPC